MKIIAKYHNVVVYEYEHEDELAKAVGDQIITLVNSHDEHCLIGLTPWMIPSSIFTYLIQDHQINKTNYKNVKFFHVDELVLNEDKYQHVVNFTDQLKINLFDYINYKNKNIYYPSEHSGDHEYSRYDRTIWQLGCLDLVILNIGNHGELGLNNPTNSNINSLTHVIRLSNDNLARLKKEQQLKKEQLPEYAITMGIRSIFGAKRIILIANDIETGKIIKEVLNNNYEKPCSLSMLINHHDVSIYVDRSAGKEIRNL